MAANTINKNFPYPEDSDQPDIASDIRDLAIAVDTELNTFTVSDLADVTLANIANNDSLKWVVVDGVGGWKNVAAPVDNDITELSLLEDVVITEPISDNQVLVWNNTSKKWVNSSISSAVPVNLDDLSDVSVASAESGQVLQYLVDGLVGTWVARTVSGTSSDSFTTIVAGSSQSNVVASSATDTLKFINGSGITITTDAAEKSVTISSDSASYFAGDGITLMGTTFSVTANTFQPLDADLTAIAALAGTAGLLKKTATDTWELDTNTYLTSYTETDPIYSASAAAGITSTNITNWNTAYGWGNHASAGYSKNVQTTATPTGNYSISDSDLGKLVIINNSTNAATVTVSATTLAVGAKIDFTQTGTGVVTFSASGVTIRSKDSKVKLSGQYAAASLTKISGTEWLLVGSLAA